MAKNSLSLSVLKQYLRHRSKNDLIDDISNLFSMFQPARDFYQIRLAPDDDSDVIDKYKKIIENEFFPTRGFGKARLSVARKAVTDYKKVATTIEGLADLMLFYVEQGVKFTITYGDIDEPFYNGMEGMYGKVVEFIVRNGIEDQYEQRCKRIVSETGEIGWGFHDALNDIYESAFC